MYSWDYLNDIPFIPVKIYGKNLSVSSLALVDTGAKYCVIHEKLARTLKLEKVEQESLRGFGGRRTFKVNLATVDIEMGKTKNSVLFAIVKEEHFPLVAPKIVLGRNLLNRFKLTLDGKNKKIYVE